MAKIEIGKIRTSRYDGDDAALYRVKEIAVVDIKKPTLIGFGPGRLRAQRSKDKSGTWPFKKGEYKVVLEDYAPWSSGGFIESTLIENGRFISATTAIKAGKKELTNR
jgi:hypothetical protein